ncbi:MAG: hypothetical protein LBC61_04960 [Candidatus Peribacteria bacterium]|nr:hypothetical protein [Candidatus Peribacteria bacterium]
MTNYKVKKQEITKSDNKNKEKYYFLKEFSFCIVKYQINLKEILTEI